MATETQDAAKIEQLSHMRPDEIEVAAGRESEQLEGWVPELASEAEIREALEKAFDYRGDVTVTRRSSGEAIEGYLYDRTPGLPGPKSVIRMIPADGRPRVTIPWSDIAEVSFSGRDTAEGKSFETWVKNYLRKKLAGEEASLHSEPLEE